MDQYFSAAPLLTLTLAQVMVAAVLAVLAVVIGATILRRSARRTERREQREILRNQARQFQEQIQLLERELRETRHDALVSRAGLLQQRAEAIQRCYGQLVPVQRALQMTTEAVRFRGETAVVHEAHEQAEPLLESYLACFNANRIHFSENRADWVAELNQACQRSLEKIAVVLQTQDTLSRDVTDNLHELLSHAVSHSTEAQKEIEKQFRDITRQSGGAASPPGSF